MRTYVRKTILLPKHNIINIRLWEEARRTYFFCLKKIENTQTLHLLKLWKLTRAHHDVSLERHSLYYCSTWMHCYDKWSTNLLFMYFLIAIEDLRMCRYTKVFSWHIESENFSNFPFSLLPIRILTD